MPASVGVGLAFGSFDQSPFPITLPDGPDLDDFDPGRDETLALGLGAALGGPVRVRAGGALRRYTSSAFFGSSVPDERATALTADLGIDLTAPVGRWIMPTHDGGFQLVGDVSAGYALRGIGLSESSVEFGSGVFNYGPVPGAADRTPTAGVSLLVGFDAGVGTPWVLRGASVEFLTGAEDRGAAYWGLSAENVLLGAGADGDQILTRRGYRLALAEVVTLSSGTMGGASFSRRDSRGATLSLGGALRVAGLLTARRDLHALGRRLDLRYTYATYSFDDDSFETFAAHGLTLRARP